MPSQYGGGQGAAGALLASTSYTPGADGTTYTVTTTSMADLDAANLSVTFKAPASGNVLVMLSAHGAGGGANINAFFGIREGASTLVQGFVGQSGDAQAGLLFMAKITGLTPGSSHTYKWGAYVASNSLGISLGPTNGPALMLVFAA